MANDFSAVVWNVDTAFATPVAKNHITNSEIYVKSITWSDMAAGAQVVVQDRNSKTIMDSISLTANTTIVLQTPTWVNGMQVPTLTSGKLSIVVNR
jgi:hypothetical protein